MLDLPMRLVVAYGLIALVVLAIAALLLWRTRNSQGRRDRRDRDRLTERYRVREESLAAERDTDRSPAPASQNTLGTTR
jgi:uncharacterized iron-regulated membrane protein